MKLVFNFHELSKIIAEYLASQGKLEYGKETSVNWHVDADSKKSYVEFEQ